MICNLTLTRRTELGKGPARQLRREGKVPGVLYGQGDAVSISLDPIEFSKVMQAKQQGYVLISLSDKPAKGKTERNAILKEVQYDPLTGDVLHADFFEVSMDKPIKVSIPIVLTGSIPVGVTLGGVLRQRERYLPLEGLPGDIPAKVSFDASNLEIGQVIRLKDLSLEKSLIPEDDPEKVIITLTMKKKVLEEEKGEGATAETTEETPSQDTSATRG